MSSFSTWSRYSALSQMALATGLLVLLSLLLSACGSTSPTVIGGPTPTPFPGAKACAVSTADLGPGGTSKGTAPNDKATGSITIDGSSLLQPLVKQAATEYTAANSSAKITVNANDSKTGVADVESGAVQIGNSDLFAKTVSATAYTDLVDHEVGVMIFAVVVNPDVAARITNLTTQQIEAIFTGQITNWKTLGGPDEVITTIDRPSGSDTQATFTRYVLGGAATSPTVTLPSDTSSDLGNVIAGTPGAIGYIATNAIGTGGAFKGKIVPVCIDGSKPGPTDVASNNYKFWTIEHLYTKGEPTGLTKSFLAYISSDAFQKNDLLSMYQMPTSQLSTVASQAHQV
jgi:phosphate transport system substrate-binding protein